MNDLALWSFDQPRRSYYFLVIEYRVKEYEINYFKFIAYSALTKKNKKINSNTHNIYWTHEFITLNILLHMKTASNLILT